MKKRRSLRWTLARREALKAYKATMLLHGYESDDIERFDIPFRKAKADAHKAYDATLRATFKQSRHKPLGDDDGRTKAARGDGTRIKALAVVEEDGVGRGEGAVEHPDVNRRG